MTSRQQLLYKAFKLAAQAFKEAAAGITKEYFQSEDAEDAAASLKDLDDEDLHDVFVKQVGSNFGTKAMIPSRLPSLLIVGPDAVEVHKLTHLPHHDGLSRPAHPCKTSEHFLLQLPRKMRHSYCSNGSGWGLTVAAVSVRPYACRQLCLAWSTEPGIGSWCLACWPTSMPPC